MSSVPHVNIFIENDKQVRQFLINVFPSITEEDINLDVFPNSFTNGIMNKMIKCSWKNKILNPEAVIVRVKNQEFKKHLGSFFALEEVCVKALNEKGCAPKLLATFQNGFCYEYTKGETLSSETIAKEPMCWLIAEELGKMHASEITPANIKKSPLFTDRLMIEIFKTKFPKQLEEAERNERFLKVYPSLETISKEIEIVLNHVENLEDSYVVCHNDLRGENIIYNEEEGRITFVDFELVSYSSAAMEISQHFIKYCGLNSVDFNKYPTKEFQRKWIKIYLKHFYQHKGLNNKSVKDTDIDKIYVLKEKYKLLLLILDVLLVPLWETTKLPMDFIIYGVRSFEQYQKEKEAIMALELPQ